MNCVCIEEQQASAHRLGLYLWQWPKQHAAWWAPVKVILLLCRQEPIIVQ